jgi:hypothetical protein
VRPLVGPEVHVLCALSCWYFTGKPPAYSQTKGLAYRLVEMSSAQFRACARATGIVQLPCVQTPDGTWLTAAAQGVGDAVAAAAGHDQEVGDGVDHVALAKSREDGGAAGEDLAAAL